MFSHFRKTDDNRRTRGIPGNSGHLGLAGLDLEATLTQASQSKITEKQKQATLEGPPH